MLGLPVATEISKALPKKAIFAKFELRPAQRDHFDEDVAKLAIVNIISPTTIPALPKGEQIECIYVIEVQLKKQDYDPKNIQMLSKLIPQNMVFALHYEDHIQLAINHTKYIHSDWINADDAKLTLQGLNLDRVWENFVIVIGRIRVEQDFSLEEQILFNEQKARQLLDIKQIESKLKYEKQPRKKYALFVKLQELKKNNV